MSITRENLVVLKGESELVIRHTGTTFTPNKHYRCMKDGKQYLIYGEPFDEVTFQQMFEYLHDRVMREFDKVGLLNEDRTPISQRAFVQQIDLRLYGKGRNKLYVGFFGNKSTGMIGFYPSFSGDTKANFISESYQNFLNILNGELDSIDSENVQRGNSGIPLSYADIYFRKPYNPEGKDLAIYL